MKVQILIFQVVCLTFAAGFAVNTRNSSNPVPETEPVAYDYFCKEVGLFAHPDPEKCGWYIKCDDSDVIAGKSATAEVSCPPCTDKTTCNDTLLHFNPETGQCENPKGSCPARCEPCQQKGFCHCFQTCEKNKKWGPEVYCPDGYFWNPHANNGLKHGGSCDFWSNLPADLVEDYENDATCESPKKDCQFKPHKKCDNQYYYYPENWKNENERHLMTCPKCSGSECRKSARLVWLQELQTCGPCPKGKTCNFC